MASRDYLPLIEAARKKVISITQKERRQLHALYLEVAKDFSSELKHKDEHSLTYRWLKDYAKALKSDSKVLFQRQSDIILGGITDAVFATSEAQRRFFATLCPQLSERFTDVFSKANQDAVNELVSGKIYHNFAGLSTRIWNYRGEFNRDIGTVIEQGIIAKKSAYSLAKDLEVYLNPEAKKPWAWQKVYPGVNKTVDYNAQRLARTSCTHAYQLSLERSTRDNPFVEEYQWLTSNDHERVCDLCQSRNGAYFPKNNVPLDHPNGMCALIPVIRKSYNEIAEELADWANGGKNEGLDRWLRPTNSIASYQKSGIITIGSDRVGIDLDIDRFTPCLIERSTGKIIETTYKRATKKDLTGLNRKGWLFHWTANDLNGTEVYKLTLKGQDDIQGLVALSDFPQDNAVYVNIAESAPQNLGANKIYEGVGGHLFAIAAKESISRGYGGFIFMDAKNRELVKHYQEKMGAVWLGVPHEYRMFIDEEAAQRLLEIYTLGG